MKKGKKTNSHTTRILSIKDGKPLPLKRKSSTNKKVEKPLAPSKEIRRGLKKKDERLKPKVLLDLSGSFFRDEVPPNPKTLKKEISKKLKPAKDSTGNNPPLNNESRWRIFTTIGDFFTFIGHKASEFHRLAVLTTLAYLFQNQPTLMIPIIGLFYLVIGQKPK